MKKTQLELQVRYKETDKMGRVYHSNYFVWFDMARTEYLRQAGVSYKVMEDEGVFFVVADTSCSYRSSLGFDDEVLIETMIKELKKASVIFTYEVLNKQTKKLVAQASTVLAAVDGSGKVIAIPEKVLKKLEGFNV